MGMFCQPSKTPDGRDTSWGTVDPEDLFGPQGWCMAAEPRIQCDCYLDGGFWLPAAACRCLLLPAAACIAGKLGAAGESLLCVPASADNSEAQSRCLSLLLGLLSDVQAGGAQTVKCHMSRCGGTSPSEVRVGSAVRKTNAWLECRSYAACALHDHVLPVLCMITCCLCFA
jgi:hypothetical protein